jgi:hypothetical protein
MRSRVIAAFCLFVLILVVPGIALGVDYSIGKGWNMNLRGEFTYALKVRTEWPTPEYIDPRSPYYVSGDANFDKGDVTNNAFIGVVEMVLGSKNVTFFARVVGLIDTVYFDQEKYNSETREHAAYNITDGLEFYVEGRAGNFTTRWGRQIMQWGESTAPIWAPGVNVVSPFMVQRVGTAGFNMRSWQVPTYMAWFGYELSENLSVEAIWQPDFEPRYFMPVVGTFQSPADILGFGVDSDLVIDRRPTDWTDQQQGGLALRMVIPQAQNLELGLYYYNYLSRWPMITQPEIFPPKLFIDWPRLDLIGLAFTTAIQNWGLNLQLGGEITYRPNEPLQLSGSQSPFIASVTGLAAGSPGYEASNTIAWDINAMRFFFDIFSFSKYTFQLSPIVEFYGKINLDYEESALVWYTDPKYTAYYSIQCPLASSDIIDNARLDLSFGAMGGLHPEQNLMHQLGFTAALKYGDNWETLFGYNLCVGSLDQDPMGKWMRDRDNFVWKLTYYWI